MVAWSRLTARRSPSWNVICRRGTRNGGIEGARVSPEGTTSRCQAGEGLPVLGLRIHCRCLRPRRSSRHQFATRRALGGSSDLALEYLPSTPHVMP